MSIRAPVPPATSTHDPWSSVVAARLPVAELSVLAPLRDRMDIRIHLESDRAWVCWKSSGSEVISRLLAAAGVEFFSSRNDAWFPFASRLPTAQRPPAGEGMGLANVLVPGRFQVPAVPAAAPPAATLHLVRGGLVQPATAMVCRLSELVAWADRATTAEIADVTGCRFESRVLLLGRRLPSLAAARRYFGEDVLIPVGFRADPELPAAAIRGAVGAATDEIVVLEEDGTDIVPRAAFEPLTRAGIRLAARDTTAP
jgi:hypothetical protein